MRTITGIIVHHSAGSASRDTAETVRRVHIEGRGWRDVGYHYIIDKNGVALGRAIEDTGAHDSGQNKGTIGICLVGDWRPDHDGSRPWKRVPHRWLQLVRLCADLLDIYDLPTSALEGHRENEPASTPTACPGFAPNMLRSAVSGERQRRRQHADSLYPYTSKE